MLDSSLLYFTKTVLNTRRTTIRSQKPVPFSPYILVYIQCIKPAQYLSWTSVEKWSILKVGIMRVVISTDPLTFYSGDVYPCSGEAAVRFRNYTCKNEEYVRGRS